MPALEGAFVCCFLQDGVLTAAESVSAREEEAEDTHTSEHVIANGSHLLPKADSQQSSKNSSRSKSG